MCLRPDSAGLRRAEDTSVAIDPTLTARLVHKMGVSQLAGEPSATTDPDFDTDFDTMEPIAETAAAGLAEGTLATSSNGKPSASEPSRIVPTVVRAAPFLTSRAPGNGPDGSMTHNEPVAHCPACRRDFFPSTPPCSASITQITHRVLEK